MKYTKEKLKTFLSESNAIEGVYDKDSLKQATEAWKFLIKQKVMTPGVILKTHKILMLNQPLIPDQKGYFRKVPVWIRGKEARLYTFIQLDIEIWCGDVNTSINFPGENGKHIKLDHITYENIHPFVDGNGRTGRLFWQWQRLKAGLPFEIIYKKDVQEYYEWFK